MAIRTVYIASLTYDGLIALEREKRRLLDETPSRKALRQEKFLPAPGTIPSCGFPATQEKSSRCLTKPGARTRAV